MTSGNVSEFPVEPHGAPPLLEETRPLYWSVRRELWENKSLYLVPIVVAIVVLFGSFVATVSAPSRVTDPAKRRSAITRPAKMAPAPIMLASFVLAAAYCLDSLYGDRRDRSILFWKSLPVSDLTTVVAKASIPFVVIPAIVLSLSLAVKLILNGVSAGVLAGAGMGPPATRPAGLLEQIVVMVYGYYAHILWFAPIFGWLLLVSAWARRAPILWAVLPPLAIGTIEAILFSSVSFMGMLKYRFAGAMREAFAPHARDGNVKSVADLAPLHFFTTPGLWLGLIFAAACLYGAARLRRNHQPA